MGRPSLVRRTVSGVTLLGDLARPGGVTFGFTERTGGVSAPPYDSLNLGDRCGDDAGAVRENTRRALAALGCEGALDRLVHPRQVHGDEVVVVRASDDASLAEARAACEAGADAVVCVARGVPVLLVFADCVPVVVCGPGGFAVAHAGRAGALAGIAGKAARTLAFELECAPAELTAYVGPHILGGEYEVAPEMVEEFVGAWGPGVRVPGKPRHLAFDVAIQRSLARAGLPADAICDPGLSTVGNAGRFFSFRASGGSCGRHAAIAYLP